MKKRILSLTACLPFVPNIFAGTPQNPNVVIILADDMGYGDVSFNNPLSRVKTPHIDAMAKKGITFSDAHTGGAVSTPSRYGLLTGRYFFRVEVPEGHWGYLPPLIEPKRETLGTLMQRAGYTTGCIGKWHLGLDWAKKEINKPLIPHPEKAGYTNTDFTQRVGGGPSDLGFDYSYIMPASLDMPPYMFIKNGQMVGKQILLTADCYPKSKSNTIYASDRKHTSEDDIYWERGVWWRNGEMSNTFSFERCLDDIADEGIAFIERESQQEKPFFLYLPLTGPHTPWMPNEKYKGTTDIGTFGDFIAQIDAIVERVYHTLEEQGVAENTIVIFTSDNGGAWTEDDIQQYGHNSNYGCRGQKGDIWDGGHHVPLFVTWPKQMKKAQHYAHTLSLVDFMATFSALTNESIRKDYSEDSFSFLPVLNGDIEYEVRSNIIYESFAKKLALKCGDWKYIDCIGSGGFTAPTHLPLVKNGVKGQLYNMKKDPMETKNLYFIESQKAKELKHLLQTIVSRGTSKVK